MASEKLLVAPPVLLHSQLRWGRVGQDVKFLTACTMAFPSPSFSRRLIKTLVEVAALAKLESLLKVIGWPVEIVAYSVFSSHWGLISWRLAVTSSSLQVPSLTLLGLLLSRSFSINVFLRVWRKCGCITVIPTWEGKLSHWGKGCRLGR